MFCMFSVLQILQSVTASNGLEVWIETVTSAVQTANSNGKVPGQSTPPLQLFKLVVGMSFNYFVVGWVCVCESLQWETYYDLSVFFWRFESILVPFGFRKGHQRIFASKPSPDPVQLSTLIDTCAWHIYLPWQILLRLRFQSVGISTSNPWCRRFVRMLPSRFRSSWFCPPIFRSLASSSQEDMAVARSKARPWDDFRHFCGRVVDPCYCIILYQGLKQAVLLCQSCFQLE